MSQSENVIVETKSGKIEGSYQQGICVFKGIPYAAPPVGERRWLSPEPVEPWKDVRHATTFGTIAPQNIRQFSAIKEYRAEEPQSEDCLYLNVWSPGIDGAHRPVLVWIHGGAFNVGSGSQPMYAGNNLALRGNVVVVTINYRLGVLGFLRLKEVTGGRVPATGNEGLLDQIAALKWVQENIAAFGGDSDNVTVFGESAGGSSIGCLLAMPQARGLFDKAILQSGVGGMATPLDMVLRVAEQFPGILGIDTGDAGALRALPVEHLLSAELELIAKGIEQGDGLRITATVPVVDGKTLPIAPLEAVKRGFAGSIPLLVGSNLEEWKAFGVMDPGLPKLDEAGLVRRLQAFIPAEHVQGLIEAYRNARARRSVPTSPAELFMAIQTDRTFRIPCLRLVEAQRHHNQSTYNYLFTWKSPILDGILGACHALDIGFVFGTHNDIFCGSGPAADRFSEDIQDAWLAFARTGNPSCESAGTWLPYGERRVTMILGEDCHTEEAPYEEERRAWDFI